MELFALTLAVPYEESILIGVYSTVEAAHAAAKELDAVGMPGTAAGIEDAYEVLSVTLDAPGMFPDFRELVSRFNA